MGIYFSLFLPTLERSAAAPARLLGVISARFNKAIMAEKWQTLISLRSSASRSHRGRLEEHDLIKSLASAGFMLIRVERLVSSRRLLPLASIPALHIK